MTDTLTASVSLAPDPRNVGEARRMLRSTLLRSGAEHLIDPAVLVLSELVTNSFVHAGTDVRVHLWSTRHAVRVEVEDGVTHLPSRRHYADTAGTGRGMQLLDGLTDRWGAVARSGGKSVWFEIGVIETGPLDPPGGVHMRRGSPTDTTGHVEGPTHQLGPSRLVTLRHVPLLMHMAWQEHAATLLREYLLHVLDTDAGILDRHAQASEAMSILNDQLPAPELPDAPEALMAGAVEPRVTADEILLLVPAASIQHFAVLDALLHDAVSEARAGRFLCPPTQPEIEEMRHWLCTEIAVQSAGGTTTTPWVARTDVRATVADHTVLALSCAGLAGADEPLVATDEASIIVAVSEAAVALLGYASTADLLGRRVLVVVPARFHQAHIAGTTLNATNGRDKLLGVAVDVPMVRADGTEMAVRIEIQPELLDDDRRVFVARFQTA